jgi:hypothetical protein
LSAVVVDAEVVERAVAVAIRDCDNRIARCFARHDLDFGLIAPQPVDLVDALFKIRQAQHVADAIAECPCRAGIGEQAAAMRVVPGVVRIARTQRLTIEREARHLARHDVDLQRARCKILRTQISACRDVAPFDERFRHASQQQIDAVATKPLVNERCRDAI